MRGPERILSALGYTLIVVVTFTLVQTVVVVSHELTHSTVAWFLGHMISPLDIVWGNPLTLRGWDEGVDYTALFSSGQLTAAAMIGVSPLIMHTVIVTAGIALMVKGIPANRWLFHSLFWFVIGNFMELIAYIVMRSFVSSGDVGIFNRGMEISPWFLFSGGSLVIVWGVAVLFGKVVPRLYALFAGKDRLLEWMILILAAFLLFLWGSGMRLAFYLYPDSQWMFGLLGLVAFGVVLDVYNPAGAVARWGRQKRS